jgi:hypothetical protein
LLFNPSIWSFLFHLKDFSWIKLTTNNQTTCAEPPHAISIKHYLSNVWANTSSKIRQNLSWLMTKNTKSEQQNLFWGQKVCVLSKIFFEFILISFCLSGNLKFLWWLIGIIFVSFRGEIKVCCFMRKKFLIGSSKICNQTDYETENLDIFFRDLVIHLVELVKIFEEI